MTSQLSRRKLNARECPTTLLATATNTRAPSCLRIPEVFEVIQLRYLQQEKQELFYCITPPECMSWNKCPQEF